MFLIFKIAMGPFIRKKNNAKPKQHQNVKKNVVLGGHFTP